MKVVCGLGNPGPEYAATRHNVGWWLLDHLQQVWGFERFRRDGAALISDGRLDDVAVRLIKPTTYMNRSGAALRPLLGDPQFNPATDLLVVVDDTALAVGRMRFRPNGSPGGHNGLKSIEATLRSREYARLRIGIGEKPPGSDLADYVLAPFDEHDRVQIMELLPVAAEGVEVWIQNGTESAMQRYNR